MNRAVEATGWGTLEFGGPLSTTLQKVSLNVISNENCETQYPAAITPQQMCTFRRNKDTCQVQFSSFYKL